MQPAEVLVCPANGNTAIYTPWTERPADNARFTYEIIKKIGAPTVAVDVLHKDSKDVTVDGTSAGSTWTASGNFYAQTITGLKELIRFKITVSSNTNSDMAVLYRFLETTWYDDAV